MIKDYFVDFMKPKGHPKKNHSKKSFGYCVKCLKAKTLEHISEHGTSYCTTFFDKSADENLKGYSPK